ncbi:MAG: type II toxin-antitoxin system HipA family toxin [Ignavibacteriae bacterium]|nr:MAG: type II toxin-antitoxin system HipA family toxin [Ignavibacteriota bacterium]
MNNLSKCLLCYKPINDIRSFIEDAHVKCCNKLFGKNFYPKFEYQFNDIVNLSNVNIKSGISIPGVQPKVLLHIENKSLVPSIELSEFILKPPQALYPQIVELEDITMHLASLCKIKTAEHGLLRLKSGELVYLTRRFDRYKGKKIAVEDLCQLSETYTENKYHTSMEKIGKTILKYSDFPGIDILLYFERTIFFFLTGNADMYPKNFSLITEIPGQIKLSPAYDLLPSKLVIPEDKEEMALSLNDKKSNFTKNDFITFARNLGINDKVITNTFDEFKKYVPLMLDFLDKGFLSEYMVKEYKKLIEERANRLNL